MLCVLTVLALLCTGCATYNPFPVVRKPRVFRGESFDYYNRAMWQLYERRLDEGEADLRRALALEDTDSWETRTYGVHFAQYFPHRELGVVLYHREQYEAAEHELATSLAQSPSSRAAFYLNRARREVLRQSGRDREDPQLTLAGPIDGLVTRDPALAIAGIARDDHYVAAVTIDGDPVFIELATPEVAFEKSVPLTPGDNRIEIVVEDLLGRRARRTLEVTADRKAPLLLVHAVERRGAAAHLRASFEDAAGIRAATVAGVDLDPAGRQTVDIDRTFPAAAAGLAFAVEDMVGNRLEGTIDTGRAAGQSDTGDGLGYGYCDAGRPRFSFASALDGVLFAALGEEPPASLELRLGGMAEGTDAVMLDRFFLEGSARSDGTVTSLQVNGRELLTRHAQQVYFGETLPLRPATNEFVIAAADAAGRRVERALRVERLVPAVLAVGSRLSLVVADFEALPAPDSAAAPVSASAIADGLDKAFVDGGRFRVLEREQLEAILLERRLSALDLARPSVAATVGRLQEAETILTGYAGLRSAEQGLEVVGRLVDTETGKVLFAHDVYGEDLDEVGRRRLLDGLQLKFARHFPLLSGEVSGVEGGALVARLEHAALLRPGMKFLVYREGEAIVHPVTGEQLGRKTEILGDCAVDEIAADGTTVRMGRERPAAAARAGDRVIAK